MGWTDASEAALLEIWPNKLFELLYAEMAEELNQQGHSCSPRNI